MRKFTVVLGCSFVALSSSCGPSVEAPDAVPGTTGSVGSDSSSCPKATVAVTPVPAESFVPGSYAGRSFLVPQNHLGEDILLPEGAEVRSPAAGTVVFYGPASGYGELLAVVEHSLAVPITVRNGTGDYSTVSTFLSIAGHLRKSKDRDGAPLAFKTGDCVIAGQTIGYVNDAAHNGDGGVHVHSGARLMSNAEAKSRDDTAPYRGYDTADGKWKGDFASMHETLSAISAAPTWHPDGTLIQVAGRPEIWHLEYGRRRYVPSEQVFNEARYYTGGSPSVWNRLITVTETELACYEAGLDVSIFQTARVISCQDGIYLAPATQNARYRIMSEPGTAEYAELLKSWGFASADPVSGDPGCSLGIGPWRLNLRDGTLVKEVGKSDVYAVADGIAWPIVSWDTFLALGYKQSNIQVVPAGSLKDLVMSVSGEVIDSSYVSRCADAMALWCTDQMCQASIGGGSGAVDPPPDGTGGSSGASGNGGTGGSGGSSTGGSGGGQSSSGGDGGSSSVGGSSGAGGAICVPKPEVCNDQDDDCDGKTDNGFDFLWDSGHCGSCYVSCDRPNTQFGCVNGACEWWGCQPGWSNSNGNWSDGCESLACVPSVEVCNGQDDDCDGAVDENGVCAPPDAGSSGGSGGSSQDAGAPDSPGPLPGAGHTVRVVYPATQCLNNDMLNWTKDCPGGPFDKTWTGVTNGLKRMNYQVNGQWLCGETYPGQVVTPYGLPQVTVDGANVQAFAIHDWRMNWGCNVMVCIGGPCELCCNGVDDDGDGFVDTADGDCQDAIACFP